MYAPTPHTFLWASSQYSIIGIKVKEKEYPVEVCLVNTLILDRCLFLLGLFSQIIHSRHQAKAILSIEKLKWRNVLLRYASCNFYEILCNLWLVDVPHDFVSTRCILCCQPRLTILWKITTWTLSSRQNNPLLSARHKRVWYLLWARNNSPRRLHKFRCW